jgi:hypothetical protein
LALEARFIKTCSSWLESPVIFQRSGARRSCMSTILGMVRSKSLAVRAISWFRSRGFKSASPLRLKVRIRLTKSRARSAAFRTCSNSP